VLDGKVSIQPIDGYVQRKLDYRSVSRFMSRDGHCGSYVGRRPRLLRSSPRPLDYIDIERRILITSDHERDLERETCIVENKFNSVTRNKLHLHGIPQARPSQNLKGFSGLTENSHTMTTLGDSACKPIMTDDLEIREECSNS
jgi:hypothetical protein